MLGEINAAAGAVASRLWAAEDWASSKLTSSLHWSHDGSDGGGSGATHGGSGHTRAKVAGHGGGAKSSSLTSAGGGCIPVRDRLRAAAARNRNRCWCSTRLYDRGFQIKASARPKTP